MKAMHLSEKEAMSIATKWHTAIDSKSHQYEPLWSFIKEVCSTFGLTWREDLGHFVRDV